MAKKNLDPKESILDKKSKVFKYYQNKAIDFSRKNRLLKFPARAVSVDFAVDLNDCENYFGPLTECGIELPHKEILAQDEEEGDVGLFTEEEAIQAPNSLPQTNLTGKKLITNLDKLRLQAKHNFDSHGLHTLFLTIGEVCWKEQLAGRGSSEAISDYDYIAPLFMIPVQITNKKTPQKLTAIHLNDELYDIQVNPVLKLFIEQKLELKCPNLPVDFSEFNWEDITDLLESFEKVLKENSINCATSTKIRLGQFTFHGQQIYEDLMRNQDAMSDHDFISGLCGSSTIMPQSSSSDLEDTEDENIDDFLSIEQDYTILDADESQIRAIKSVLAENHLVIHGPPGTGKSQTIANLISNLLARQKKVLFVCEKQVALEVVYNRLKTAGADVSDLCLPLFQYTADKKQFAKSIIEARDRVLSAFGSASQASVPALLTERKNKIDVLKKYADALLTKWLPLDKDVYWLHSEIARVMPRVEGIVVPWREVNTDKIDYDTYKKLKHLFTELTNYIDLVRSTDSHWLLLNQTSFSPDYASRLFLELVNLKTTLVSLPKLSDNELADYSTAGGVKQVVDFFKNKEIDTLLSERYVRSSYFSQESLTEELAVTEKIKDLISKFEEVKGDLTLLESIDGWEVLNPEVSLLSQKTKLVDVLSYGPQVSLLNTNVLRLRDLVNKSNHQELLNTVGIAEIKKYKLLLETDSVIQGFSHWDSRDTVYEIAIAAKALKSVYNQLLQTQEVLNTWSVYYNDTEHGQILKIDENFSLQYDSIFRFLRKNFAIDKKTISDWCATNRPKKYSDYKEIISAVSNKIRLEARFEKQLNEFLTKYAADVNSFKDTSPASLFDAISKQMQYFELTNSEKITSELKGLLVESDQIPLLKSIIELFEELYERAEILNKLTARKVFGSRISLDNFVSSVLAVLSELLDVTDLSRVVSSYVKEEPANLSALQKMILILNELNEVAKQIKALDPEKYIGISEVNEIVDKQAEIISQQKQINDVLALLNGKNMSSDDFYQNLESLHKNIDALQSWYKSYSDHDKAVSRLMNTNLSFDDVDVSALVTQLEAMCNDQVGLERWTKFQRIKGQLIEHDLSWLIQDISKLSTNDTDLADIFTWSFLNCVLTEIYEQEPVLSNFNASDYQRHLAEFRKLEKDVFRTNQYRVLAEVYPTIKFAADRGGASEKALIRESQKVKRHIPIRRLVTENAEYLLNYKPCWMMSPLTLSSYIPYGSVEFDVVIFDEASQMKIENALGSIARAKQVVVIGDENQLPPTSFFESASDDEEEDEEELEDVGYESLLQASIATLPGLQPELLYHYRSTSDNLIAFSNHHIYGNRLITFPSPKNIDDSVKFEYVHNGVYDSGKTRRNRIEAERVADLCIEHVKNSSDSLGVIAFSKAQEEVIREVLNERIKDEPFLAEKLDEMNPVKESFFVKNLESVQGDERDTIILSVGYGPDHLGNVYNRFGPINKKGGHRRLNVAVTRAKNKIICVSSMKFFQMNPGESAKGAILLQRYLEYAESGRSVLDASKIPTQNLVEADSDFELSVQEALENIGYSVHRQIGASGFKIDLAVLHPENGNAYVLGIECDGAIYHSSKSARMRDRFRQDILERLDWQIYRVWSQHWLIHKQEILDDIVRIINKNV